MKVSDLIEMCGNVINTTEISISTSLDPTDYTFMIANYPSYKDLFHNGTNHAELEVECFTSYKFDKLHIQVKNI